MLGRVLTLVPPLLIALFVATRGVDMPYYDQWSLVEEVAAAHDGDLNFEAAFSLHNASHRVFFPRVLISALAWTTNWNIRAEQLIHFLLMAATLVAVVVAAPRVWWMAPTASVLLFSLHGFRNWLWGFSLSIALALACATWCLVLLSGRRPTALRVVGAAGLAVVASFSYLAGVLCWPLGTVLLLAHPGVSWRRRLWCVGAWLALFGGCILTLLHDVDLGAADFRGTSSVLEMIPVACAFLGTALVGSEAHANVTITAGAIVQIALVVLAVVALRKHGRITGVLTALAIGAVGVLAGYMVAIGRPADDLEAVIASRYASTAALAWVAVVLVSGHLMPRRGVAVSVALVGALAVSHTETWSEARRFSDELTTARATVLDGRHVTWEVIESFMDYRRLPEAAGWLDALRARGLSLYRGASVEQRRVSTAEPLRVPTCRLAEGPVPFEAYGAGGVPGNACALAWHLPGGRAGVERGVFDSHGQVTFALPADRVPDTAVIQIIGLDRFMRLAPSKTVTLKR